MHRCSYSQSILITTYVFINILHLMKEDVRDMPSYTNEYFDFLLDKGTLDAISSKSDEPDVSF